MSNSLNKVQIIGNMTADPEIRHTPSDKIVATVSIATNRKYKQNNETVEEVEYHRVVLWNWLAEIAEQYTSKGKKVYIEGHLKTRSWDDAQGVKRYTTEIIADNLILLWGGQGAPKTTSSLEEFPEDDHQKAEREKKAAARKKPKDEEISIEDIPF